MSSPPAWGFGGTLKPPQCIKTACYEILQRASDFAVTCENANEPSGSTKSGEVLGLLSVLTASQ
jgi:hypothetical protein